MAEAALKLDTPTGEKKAGDDEKSTTSSRKRSSSKSSKKDDMALFSERLSKQEEKFATFESKMDKMFYMLGGKDTDQNEASGTARRSGDKTLETMFSMSRLEDARQQQDSVSLYVDDEEKRDCGFLTRESAASSHHSEHDFEESDRFVKYMTGKDAEEGLDQSACPQNNLQPGQSNFLKEKFGVDAVTTKAKTNIGLSLEQNQIDILQESWRSGQPDKFLVIFGPGVINCTILVEDYKTKLHVIDEKSGTYSF